MLKATNVQWVPGAAGPAGRIGKQVQCLCGTAAVRGEHRLQYATAQNAWEGEAGKLPSRKTCPLIHPAGKAETAQRTDKTPAQ